MGLITLEEAVQHIQADEVTSISANEFSSHRKRSAA